MTVVLKCWVRYVKLYFDYLKNSEERPLGHVTHYFYRFEWQGAGSPGNLPHVHGGMVLAEGETEMEKLSLIHI